jgi:hypothetical protein
MSLHSALHPGAMLRPLLALLLLVLLVPVQLPLVHLFQHVDIVFRHVEDRAACVRWHCVPDFVTLLFC